MLFKSLKDPEKLFQGYYKIKQHSCFQEKKNRFLSSKSSYLDYLWRILWHWRVV